ncbi:MAG: LacI family DNA-binding transcriptional regulator [Verrucomicrobia bacterium]|nr:LacI family DNA-binding transcriptional regulator [Verrucomicrobiota bacterium]
MVRLKDIAVRANVSVMTVSKALRDTKDISAATRVRIQVLARQMGYVPNAAASGLRTHSTKLFGLIISAMTNPIYARVVMAIEERAHETGYELILAHSLNNAEREEVCIHRLLARRVEGLFIFPAYRPQTEAPIYNELLARRVPTVILGPKAPFCGKHFNVETNDLAASQALTRHLLDLGHKRIAFLTGPSVSPWAQERFEGYRRALREAKIEVDDTLVFHAGATIEEGEKAALQMLQENPKATALQAVNDLVAIGAANTLLNQGVRVPQDLSVVGFGNILLTEYFRVPLTTARQPKFRLGIAAVEAMGKLMRGETPAPQRLAAEIIQRLSTVAPTAAQ